MRSTLVTVVLFSIWLPCLADDVDSSDSCFGSEANSLLQVRQSTSEIVIADIDGQLELPTSANERAHVEVALIAKSGPRNQAHSAVSSFMQWAVSSAPLSQWMVTGSVAFVVVLGMVFLAAGICCPTLPRPLVSICVMAIYIALSVSIDLLILYQKQAQGEGTSSVYKFDPTCSIVLTEFIKLVFSLTLYSTNQFISGQKWLPEGLSMKDVWLFAGPAMFFTANNIMVFVAIGGNDASAFGVFRDTMILWTALIWKCVFGSSLGKVRLCGIAVIFVGLVFNRLGSLSGATFSWAFLLVILMTVTNSTGSVFNEYALKWNKEIDINLQNAILYSLCMTFSIIVLAIRSPVHLSSAGHFFEGFTNWTILMVCLQASAGLLVSRLLKYADSVYKTIGTCLRGPSLVLAAPLLLGSQKDLISVVSAFIVASGCLTYLTQGPLQQGEGAKKAGDKTLETTASLETSKLPQ